MTGWTVGEAARAAGVSARTLHHWDEVGVLRPSGRGSNGYRLYDEGDLARLQRVLAYRELGFALEEVARLLDDPDVDVFTHLRRQHALLVDRAEHLLRVAALVGTTLEATRMGIGLTPDQLREVFGDEDPTRCAEEAEQRWGDTEAWRSSHRRTSRYSPDDWRRSRAEAEAVEEGFAAALRDGVPVDAPQVHALVEEHRAHITRWFYECSPAVQRGLAEMYVADDRFAAHYERREPGLAQYVHDAVRAAVPD